MVLDQYLMERETWYCERRWFSGALQALGFLICGKQLQGLAEGSESYGDDTYLSS